MKLVVKCLALKLTWRLTLLDFTLTLETAGNLSHKVERREQPLRLKELEHSTKDKEGTLLIFQEASCRL